jgi:hypothetical protein
MIVQMNLPALERLIGGDSTIEVQLRQQIVQEFAKKHLKPMLQDPIVKKLLLQIDSEIRQYVGQEVWESGHGFTVEITAKVRDMIAKATETTIQELVAASFGTLVKNYEATALERIKRYEGKMMGDAHERLCRVLDAIDKGLDQRLDAAFEQRVQAEVQRRLDIAREIKP